MVRIKGLDAKKRSLLNLLIALLSLLLVNFISTFFFARYDLTSEKRYTLSPVSKSILKELDKKIFVEVYLDGDLPSGFKRLQIQTSELLEEFKAYSDKIHYQIVNPLKGKNAQQRKQILQYLSDKGLQATDLQVKTLEGTERKIIIPGAILGDGEKEIALDLLSNQIGVPPETILNNSIQSLEFQLINAINKLNQKELATIALISGHGELDYPYIVDIALALDKDYQLSQKNINGDLNALLAETNGKVRPLFDAIIIAKPITEFDEKDKFVIDQYVMHGGNILWLIDPVQASLDSLQFTENAMVYPYSLNLEDMLFTYGIRLNQDLIKDINALPIPLRTGQMAGQAQIKFYPWPFFPVIHPIEKHPIVRNLNALKTDFVSSIDTLAVRNIKKTILLKSSQYSALFNTPNTISFRMVQEKADPNLFQAGEQNIAVLLEGQFPSVFKNRIPPIDLGNFKSKEKGVSSKMIIVSDGDIIKNQLHNSRHEPLPLGYDQFTDQKFGNKEFILNCVSYLTDGSDLIELRSRELKLRLLDKVKINNEATYWKLLNTIFPLILVLLFAIAYYFYRKKKYSISKP